MVMRKTLGGEGFVRTCADTTPVTAMHNASAKQLFIAIQASISAIEASQRSRDAGIYFLQVMLPPRLCLLLFPAICVSASLGTTSSGTAPNVVVITIDTLRPDHLGCYGYKQIRTPNIDALAADGVRFQRAYTAVPVTLPSHTVIFTGTYPTFSGMHDFAGNKLGSNQSTLAL